MTGTPNTGTPSTAPRTVSRRAVASGLAWSAPAVAMAAAAPAFAASRTTLTGTNDALNFYQDRYFWSNGRKDWLGNPVDCDLTQQGGYITTMGTATTGTPKKKSTGVSVIDGKRDPNTSIGLWVETTNSTSGVARVDSVTQTYVFSQPIQILSAPTTGMSQNGTYVWSQQTVLNGWTYTLSPDGKTLTMTYSTPTILKTSTSTAGTGDYLPGYFLNYSFSNLGTTFCPSYNPSAFTVTYSYTVKWADKNGSYTKNYGPTTSNIAV